MKKIPKFKNEDDEREFWATADTSEYFDFSKARHVDFPNLKPTSQPISIRIPAYILRNVKMKANELDIPYQALIKQYIAKGVFEK